jgi:DNA-binding GntR family transcriptional regulator
MKPEDWFETGETGMSTQSAQKAKPVSFPALKPEQAPTVADQVFKVLHQRILTLELPPKAKISETEVASQMGVSRQPVRESFKRLARLGFLDIRPQSGTTVSLISEEAIEKARFIRTALECEVVRTACDVISDDKLPVLKRLLDGQADAIDRNDRDTFHALDEDFHHALCDLSGLGYVWDLIQEYKAHMDRVRMLSLSATKKSLAFKEHQEIYEAIRDHDPDKAASVMEAHLSRIRVLIDQIKDENHAWFLDGTA